MTLFGYGITTKAIAQKFGHCKVYDDKFTKSTVDVKGNQFLNSSEFDPDESVLEVTSPGIPPSNPLIQKAKHLISEYDLFVDKMPYSIWITGTNGKTTTTDMLEHLLFKRGGVAGGNIGTPLAKLDEKASIWILETSSFTLHYTNKAVPNIYVVLPISPDHISWHGSFEAYEAAKLKPIHMMQEGEVVILPEKYADIKTNALKLTYSCAVDLARHFDIAIRKLKFKEPFLTDALLALGVSKILFDEVDYARINAYEIGKHRVEEFYDNQGRLWVNDSKATNADATMAALKSYQDKKIFLILGGDDKGADLIPIFLLFQKLDISVYVIGANTDRIVGLCESYDIVYNRCNIIENAVNKISLKHDKNSVCLLSPAAASLDQFLSYAHRGEAFVQAVKKLS